MNDAISLLQLNQLISSAVASKPELRDVWVTAETVDVRLSGGHCYMELIDKDPNNGKALARLRAVIWASAYPRISSTFVTATGQQLVSDLKVMVRISVNFHPVFGLSAVINDINPEFTCGDLIRRRREMIKRLTDEGIIDMNRTLPVPDVANRVAVISAAGAAGYGDFINQLYNNALRLRFSTTLYNSTMQGERAPESIIAALNDIAARIDDYDCVVIIRGGGATGDLAAFENYDLAANIAQFPIPVIVGIGHDRDITILDYVAAIRVKTPTAAAEWLINHGEMALARVRDVAQNIFREATSRCNGALRQIAYYSGLLPSLATTRIDDARKALDRNIPDTIAQSVGHIMRRNADRLRAADEMLAALSPQAVLRRGYSICRVNGRAVTDASTLRAGDVMVTTLASGSATSTVNKTNQ